MWATPGDRFAILLLKPWLEPTWMAPWSRRSHSCSLGACQHRCNEVVIEMASHAICQRKACWVVRFETPNQNVLGSFCFHLKWSECFTLLYDFKVLNCNGFASRSATNEERGVERERERSCKYILKRHASMFSCIFIVLERSHSLCFFPQGQEAVSLGKMPLAELCLHCWRPVQLTPLWKAGRWVDTIGDTWPPGDSRNLWIGKMCGEKWDILRILLSSLLYSDMLSPVVRVETEFNWHFWVFLLSGGQSGPMILVVAWDIIQHAGSGGKAKKQSEKRTGTGHLLDRKQLYAIVIHDCLEAWIEPTYCNPHQDWWAIWGVPMLLWGVMMDGVESVWIWALE